MWITICKPLFLLVAPILAIWFASKYAPLSNPIKKLFRRAAIGSYIMVMVIPLFMLAFLAWTFLIDLSTVSASERMVAAALSGDAARYSDLIAEKAGNNNLDWRLVAGIIEVESNFDSQATSYAGAMGLMQLMPATASDCGVTDAYDPYQNVSCGTKFFRFLLDRYGGNTELALSAYNRGPVAVDNCNCIAGNFGYVQSVLAARDTFKSITGVVNRTVWQLPSRNHLLFGNGYHCVGTNCGRDYIAPCGAPLYSPIDGTVIAKGTDKLGNTYVSINDGFVTFLLLHGNYGKVRIGDSLDKGQLIGYEASNGNSDRCHTHITLFVNGVQSDVEDYR